MLFKRIKHRISFILFTTLLFSLIGVLAQTYWSLKQRFLEYSTQNLEQTLYPLEQDILSIYQSQGSLAIFSDNPEQWQRSKRKLLSQFRRPPPHRGGPPARERTDRPPEDKPEFRGYNPTTPKEHQDELRKNQRDFVDSLTLYNANLDKIAGNNDTPLKSLIQHQITLNNETIAIIAYKSPDFFVRSNEYLFLDQQLKSFSLIGSMGLAIALIIASFVSKSISQPLSALADTAKKIASGDFSARINIKINDEIGDICKNFNVMAEKLDEHESSRKRWVADISHEIRTPLAVLKAQIEAIEDGVRPANKENLTLLSNKVNVINHLINDLYELSLFDIGAMRCHKEPIDIGKLIKEFVADHKLQSSTNDLKFTLNYHLTHPVMIFADHQRISQLLSNILQNSERYTDRPGKIIWSISQKNNYIQLKLEDSSPSIKKEDYEKIFERLYTADESRNKERVGTGLGLSICKSIVESHDGTISAGASSLGGVEIKILLSIHSENNTG